MSRSLSPITSDACGSFGQPGWRLIEVTHDEEFRHREMARRKAQWALASILPRGAKALDVLDVLDDIVLYERHDTSMPAQTLSVEHLRDSIPIERYPIGCRIVLKAGRDDD